MGKSTKILLTMILVLLLLTGGAYALGTSYFSNHFMPGSTLNGYNVSYMTVEQAEALLDREVRAFTLAVETRGNGREAITANQVGLRYASDGRIGELIRGQEVLEWFLQFNEAHTYDVSKSMSYNEEQMEAGVKDLDCMQPSMMTAPVNAEIIEGANGYSIRKEIRGTTLDFDKVLACVSEAMVTGKGRVNLEEEDCYVGPEIYADNELLVSNCETLNRMTQGIITYDFGPQTETVDRTLVKDWITVNKSGHVVLDQKKARDYVAWLGVTYNTVGLVRNFETYDGRPIQVSGGDYGWVIDVDGETRALCRLIVAGETLVREPEYAQTAVRRTGSNDIGLTYVEVDISAQKLVYYENGQPLIETDCCTGDPNSGHPTPTGVFRAGVKESPKVLTGGFGSQVGAADIFTSDPFAVDSVPEIMEGEEAFVEAGPTANAYFWMPFGDFGITEGIMRNQFGGTLYLERGTRGNVEIVYDSALALYEKFYEGLPVVIY